MPLERPDMPLSASMSNLGSALTYARSCSKALSLSDRRGTCGALGWARPKRPDSGQGLRGAVLPAWRVAISGSDPISVRRSRP